MSLGGSIKTTWSESFGMQKPLWQGFSTGVLVSHWWLQRGSPRATCRGLYQITLQWYCKTLLMSRGPQVLGVFVRGPQTRKV